MSKKSDELHVETVPTVVGEVAINVKSNKTKETVARKDVKVRKAVADIKKKPSNNDDCGKMAKRYFYQKTGNWVVYARMLQLKRRPENNVFGDQIKTVGNDVK